MTGVVISAVRRAFPVLAWGLLAFHVAAAWGSPQPAAAAVSLPDPSATPTATAGAGPSPAEQGKTFLWKISSPTATVLLLGSIHVVSRDLYPLDPRIESAFQTAHTLVLEIPLDTAAQQQVAQKLARAGAYPAGDSIDLHLAREVLELLHRHLKRSGSSFDRVRPLRPWFVAVILILDEMQRLGYCLLYTSDAADE